MANSSAAARGDAAEKWRPPTRETADHSMPYLMAAMLVDGDIGERRSSRTLCTTRPLLGLMDRITVRERADLTARATRDSCPTELACRLVDGPVADRGARGRAAGAPREPDEATTRSRRSSHAFALRALAPTLASTRWRTGCGTWPDAPRSTRSPRIFREFGTRAGQPLTQGLP